MNRRRFTGPASARPDQVPFDTAPSFNVEGPPSFGGRQAERVLTSRHPVRIGAQTRAHAPQNPFDIAHHRTKPTLSADAAHRPQMQDSTGHHATQCGRPGNDRHAVLMMQNSARAGLDPTAQFNRRALRRMPAARQDARNQLTVGVMSIAERPPCDAAGSISSTEKRFCNSVVEGIELGPEIEPRTASSGGFIRSRAATIALSGFTSINRFVMVTRESMSSGFVGQRASPVVATIMVDDPADPQDSTRIDSVTHAPAERLCHHRLEAGLTDLQRLDSLPGGKTIRNQQQRRRVPGLRSSEAA